MFVMYFKFVFKYLKAIYTVDCIALLLFAKIHFAMIVYQLISFLHHRPLPPEPVAAESYSLYCRKEV